jgi:hypothetical protein
MIVYVEAQTERSTLLVFCSINHLADPGLLAGGKAHRAGLESHKEVAVDQPPGSEILRCLAYGRDFRVPERILISLTGIRTATDDPAILHDHGTDWYLAGKGCGLCQGERLKKKDLGFHWARPFRG